MKYIVYRKNANKVLHILDKEPKSYTDNLSVARCERIPQGNKFKVINVKEHKENVTKTIADDNGTETETTITIAYNTCELIAEDMTNDNIKAEIALMKEYLNKTDYITDKFVAAIIVNDTKQIETLKQIYSNELSTRAQYRNKINELEKELKWTNL